MSYFQRELKVDSKHFGRIDCRRFRVGQVTFDHISLVERFILREPLPLAEHETVQVTVQSGKTGNLVPPNDSAEIEPMALNPASRSPLRIDPPIIPEEWEMVDLVLNVPPSPNARTVKARLGRLPMPDPPIIPWDDFK